MSKKFKKVMFFWEEGKKNVYISREEDGTLKCKQAEDEENNELYERAVKEFNTPLSDMDLEYKAEAFLGNDDVKLLEEPAEEEAEENDSSVEAESATEE